MQKRSDITDAEWQIMKVIWSNSPCTSSFIIDKLSVSRNWAATTVKTLLSRLTKKNVISFDTQGRTRSYFPLLTELECVYSEMGSVINKIYGGIINLETEHFVFYGENKKEYIYTIAAKLEENYYRVLKCLDFTCDEKTMVYTYDTLQRFHSAMGVPNAPKWMRAGYMWDIVHMAPEKHFDNIDAAETAIHVFVSIIIYRINRSTPYWLVHGVSTYLSGWLSDDRKANAIRKSRNEISKEFIAGISKDYESFTDGFGYEIASTIAEYIVMKYGYQNLSKLIKNPNSLEEIFACKAFEFWQGWINFVDSEYINR